MIHLQELEKVSAAEAARRSIEEIEEKDENGVVKAEAVVEAARHPDHVLHRYFEWDDSAAAEQWRLMQARALIRKVMVTMPTEEGGKKVPKYISLRNDRKKPGGGYRPAKSIVRSKKLLAELEETAKKDLDGFLGRFELLKEFCAKIREAAGIS